MHKDFFNPESAPYIKPLVDRRVALITGANSGLGWYTVLHLYLHGYVVYIAGRNLSRVRAAITGILIEANKRVQQYTEAERMCRRRGEIHFLYMDLSKLQTVVDAAKQFCLIEQKLHVLINNAGIMAVPFEITEDGFELQFQVNYLGHFILTQKLLPCLLEVADDPSEKEVGSVPRIVNLSSIAHHFEYKHFSPRDPIKKSPGFLYSWVRYGRSKTCLVHFTKELADRYPEILSIAIHPGVITNTKLFNYWKNIMVIGPIAKGAFKTFDFVNGISPEEGSFALLRAAMDPELTRFENSGCYLVTGGREETPSKIARDNLFARELWDTAMQIMKDFELKNDWSSKSTSSKSKSFIEESSFRSHRQSVYN